MFSPIQDLPVTLELAQGTLRAVSWGNMTIEVGQVKQDFVPEQELKGVVSNHCQCPHWGYVLKGRMRLKYPDREETYQEGDVYYALPNHLTYFEAGCEYIEFSPTLDLLKARESVKENAITAEQS